jgi:2-desacetyl-2-hydroxyethyl bacteriochlorophyllide A dehydrogenase
VRARAVRFVAPYRVDLDEVSVPEPADGQLLVRAECSGISAGTEMLAYRGELDPRLLRDEALGALGGTFEYPFSYGYSAVGRVERSRGALQEGTRVFAFHPHQELFVVDERDALPLDGGDARLAALLPLVETGLQISLDAGPRLEEHVVVMGLGCVGALAAALLARAGARVVGAEPHEPRRRAAAELGVASVAPEELPGRVREASGGRGATLLVEATGNPAALVDGLPLLAHEGTALVCSWYGTKTVPLPLGAEFHRRRLTLRSSQVSSIPSELAGRWDRRRRLEAARRLLSELPLAALATHDFDFERAPEAYAAIDRPDPALVHAALRYG